MAWKLAPALAALISDVNDKWPLRSKAVDGTIGDASHSARKSEHNPNREPGDDVPDGYVTAADITTEGLNKQLLLSTLKSDRRVWYVIHDRKIWSRTYGFKQQAYTGSNPHTSHIHVSLVQTKAACNDTSAWFAKAPKPKPAESHYQRLVRLAHERYVYIGKLKAKLRAANRRNR